MACRFAWEAMTPSTEIELRDALARIAERSVAIVGACTNEESTKLYLVLPVLGALGYDYSNPFEVQPEYPASFREQPDQRVDFVVLRDGVPSIAVECKPVGTYLVEHRGQLRSYFNALRTTRLGVLTNGMQFEFFVDSDEPNIMDDEPFLVLDMNAMASSASPSEVVAALSHLSRGAYDPSVVVDTAAIFLLRRRLRSVVRAELKEPSEGLCRHLLGRAGIKNQRRDTIRARYTSLVKAAFEEGIIVPVLEHLRAVSRPTEQSSSGEPLTERIITTERELAVFRYVTRRLAYLVEDERSFNAIERVQYRDYLGKFVVYYENVRKGRLFDFEEGHNGYDHFTFPPPFGGLVTNTISNIDKPLREIFARRTAEIGFARGEEQLHKSA